MRKNLSIAIIFFNRPNHLEKVFSMVKKTQPDKLFLIQDGPRDNNDLNKIDECREIVEKIEWECEVHRNYSNVNLGCGKRPSTGITWAFNYTESLIILEDDCLPDESFFKYCEEMLNKYKDDLRIGLIAGTNPFGTYDFGGYDYGFVKSGGIWGWATWKNRWEKYDYFAKSIKNEYLKKCLENDVSIKKSQSIKRIKLWDKAFYESNNYEKISYWDYQWGLARHINSFLTIVPRVNLIKNIGCDNLATHENDTRFLPKNIKKMMFNETFELEVLKHPDFVVVDRFYDYKYYEIINPTFIRKCINKMIKFLKMVYYKITD